MIALSIRFPEKLYAQLKRAAKAQHRPLATYVRLVLHAHENPAISRHIGEPMLIGPYLARKIGAKPPTTKERAR